MPLQLSGMQMSQGWPNVLTKAKEVIQVTKMRPCQQLYASGVETISLHSTLYLVPYSSHIDWNTTESINNIRVQVRGWGSED